MKLVYGKQAKEDKEMLKRRVLVLHGPNLDLLGVRETGIYGKESLENVNARIMDEADNLNIDCEIHQSNSEGGLIDFLHAARENFDGVVINAGAYTHYSIAIRDAIAAIKIPCVEVHMSNVFAREDFRKNSVIAPVCAGSISGFGKVSYILALRGLKDLL